MFLSIPATEFIAKKVHLNYIYMSLYHFSMSGHVPEKSRKVHFSTLLTHPPPLSPITFCPSINKHWRDLFLLVSQLGPPLSSSPLSARVPSLYSSPFLSPQKAHAFLCLIATELYCRPTCTTKPHSDSSESVSSCSGT